MALSGGSPRAIRAIFATALNNLATLYRDQGNYAEAQPLYKRALAIDAMHRTRTSQIASPREWVARASVACE